MDTNTARDKTQDAESLTSEGRSALTRDRTSGSTPPAKPPTETRVVMQQDDLTLVEWHSGHKLHRAWVTKDKVVTKTDNVATVQEPNSGVPYGVDWSRLVELQTTPAQVEEELHARGIWTLADLRANPVEVIAAIQAAYGLTRAALLQAAERYEEKLKDGG